STCPHINSEGKEINLDGTPYFRPRSPKKFNFIKSYKMNKDPQFFARMKLNNESPQTF
ncbi:MAG: hypothetical protein MHPSP_004166, partial [Paramarteilia canceri]